MTEIEKFEREFDDWQPRNGNGTGPAARRRDAAIPVKDKIVSALGLGTIPPGQVFAADAIVQESNRLDALPADGELTLTEQAVRAKVMRRAERGLEKAVQGPFEQQIEGIKGDFAQINLVTELIDETGRLPLLGPNGELLTQEETRDAHDTQRDQVTGATGGGSQEHLIRRRGGKWKEIGMLLIDFPVFLLAMMGVLNVSPRRVSTGDGASLLLFGTAAVFALLGTLLYAVLMRTMGHRHRRFKNRDSAITATDPAVRRRLLIEQAATVSIAVAASLVMGIRIYIEGLEADAHLALVVVLAVLFAILIGVSGYINYMSEYENGSETTDRVQHLAAQLAGIEAALHTLRKQQAGLIEKVGIKLAALARAIDNAEERAVRTVTGSRADKAIAVARSYYGSRTPVPAPTFDHTTVELIKEQARQLADHHQILKTAKEN